MMGIAVEQIHGHQRLSLILQASRKQQYAYLSPTQRAKVKLRRKQRYTHPTSDSLLQYHHVAQNQRLPSLSGHLDGHLQNIRL